MKIICFGDNWGVPMLCQNLPLESDIIIVGAEIRPQYHRDLHAYADSLSAEFIIQPKKTSPAYDDFIEHIKAHEPEFFFVNSYSMLLHTDLLSIPKNAAINIHGALLPQYRGCNPIQWALLNDEKETGVTMHYMDADFDTGDIIAHKKVPILEEDTWLDIQRRIAHMTEEMLSEEIPKLMVGTNSRMPQGGDSARYWKRRRPEDGFFDWKWRARDIYNLIRALVKPNPGAFYLTKDGIQVTIGNFMPYELVQEMQRGFLGKVVD